MAVSEIAFLSELEGIIRDRLHSGAADSYTVRLATEGTRRIAQKVGEEAVELALASVTGDAAELLDEAADLVYHLIVLLANENLGLADVAARLEQRHRA